MELTNNIIIIITLLVFVFSLLLLQKLTKFDFHLKAIIIVFISLFSAMILLSIKGNTEFEKLKNDYAFSEGTILEYINNEGKKPTKRLIQKVKYKYLVDNYIYTNQINEYSEIVFPYFKPNLEMKYLVIYEKNNPQNSYILFNYPLNNTIQKDEYIKLFEKGIPENVFEK
ncbi:MAG: hypothetical protein WCY89_02600 [Flavobacteriaceae bacterium]